MVALLTTSYWMTFWIPVILFAISTSASPGPVNILVLSTSATSGISDTIPLISGASWGFALLLVLLGMGFNSILTDQFIAIVKIFGIGFIIYLAFMMWVSNNIKNLQTKKKTFLDGMILQFSNPKAIVVALSAVSIYPTRGTDYLWSLLSMVIIYLIVCYLSLFLWAIFGSYFHKKLIYNKINKIMSAVLLSSILTIL